MYLDVTPNKTCKRLLFEQRNLTMNRVRAEFKEPFLVDILIVWWLYGKVPYQLEVHIKVVTG